VPRLARLRNEAHPPQGIQEGRAELTDRAREAIAESEREEQLTVKEFAARFRMTEHGVRDAIRDRRLNFRIVRLTNGPKGAIRIVVPRTA
jgi:AraC-like DNA-binding protein